MNKFYKIVIIVLLIVVGILLLYSFNLRRNSRINSRNIRAMNMQLASFKDNLGRSTVKVQVLEATNSAFKIFINSKDSSIRNLSREVLLLKAKLRRIDNVSIVNTNSSGSNSVVVVDSMVKVINDTVKVFAEYAEYKDDWINISFFKYEDADSAQVMYSVNNSILAAIYRDRPMKPDGKKYRIPLRWFKGWIYNLEAKSLNPNATVTSASSVMFIKRGKRQ